MKDFDRKQGIGGSEIAACIGLNPWMSPLKLWAIKTGAIEEPDLSDNESVYWGNVHEEAVAKRFTEKTGLEVRRDARVFRHPKHNFLYGHIDRLVLKEDAVLEVKTTSEFSKKEWEGDKIPLHYVAQLSFYLGLTKRKVGYFSALIGGNKFVWKKIEFDKELYDRLIDGAVTFWTEFVVPRVPPMASALDNDGTLDLLYPRSGENVLRLEDKPAKILDDLIESRLGGLEQRNLVQKELDTLEAQIKLLIGENEALETGSYRASWKSQDRTYADTDKLKEDNLFEKYSKVTSSRVLRTKKLEPPKEKKK